MKVEDRSRHAELLQGRDRAERGHYPSCEGDSSNPGHRSLRVSGLVPGDKGAASLSNARALAFVATQLKLPIYFPTDVARTTRGQCARSHGTMEGVCVPVAAASACD